MSVLSAEKRALIEGARQQKTPVTSKQIDRWRLDDLLPKAAPHGRGRGLGVARVSSEATLQQLLALAALLRHNRSLHHVALRLWLGGFAVPIQRVRKALTVLVARPWKAALEKPADHFDEEFANLEETILRRKHAPKLAKKLARQHKVAPLCSMLFRQLKRGNDPPDQEQIRTRVGDIEQLTGIVNARRGEPGHGGTPWLKGDITEDISSAVSLGAEVGSCIDQASDLQLEQAREAFLHVEKIVAWSQYAKRAYGHAFGLEALEGTSFDATGNATAPLLFAVILLMVVKQPKLYPAFETVGTSAGNVGQQLEAQLKKTQHA